MNASLTGNSSPLSKMTRYTDLSAGETILEKDLVYILQIKPQFYDNIAILLYIPRYEYQT